MKKAGLLLTGKAKKEADRLAAIREQMLRTAGDAPAGLSPSRPVKWQASHLAASPAAAAAISRSCKYTLVAELESWLCDPRTSWYSSQQGLYLACS